MITSTLTLVELYKIFVSKTDKDMWEVFKATYEGTEEIKMTRKNSLVQEYEMFQMQQ